MQEAPWSGDRLHTVFSELIQATVRFGLHKTASDGSVSLELTEQSFWFLITPDSDVIVQEGT